MTIGHLKEITQYLPDDMLVMTPIDISSDSVIRSVCNKSKVEQIEIEGTGHVEYVLLLVPCMCDVEIMEDQQEIAHSLLINDAIDN